MLAAKTFRLHIGIFGRRNVGKSSILNALTRQQISIVSEFAGTTTDPVEKPMELLPLGPVQFIDTAGIDDTGKLGKMRIEATKKIFERTDLAILVTDSLDWGEYETTLLDEFKNKGIPFIVVINKVDLLDKRNEFPKDIYGNSVVYTSTQNGTGLSELRQAILVSAPEEFINRPGVVSDLVKPGETAVLVVPIDKEAPKGRLILPQVQTIRDLLDHDSISIVCKERELKHTFDSLKKMPSLVVTDSQAFLKVAADTPPEIPMTSFSILFARFQGDLGAMVQGACAIDKLHPGDRVLIAEACSHHPIGEDIGRVKIPRWLTQYVGGKIDFVHMQGHDFPKDLSSFSLVIHCGACMWNRREMISRILQCQNTQVPITNYGLAIAYSLGIFERALTPFPGVLELYRNETRKL